MLKLENNGDPAWRWTCLSTQFSHFLRFEVKTVHCIRDVTVVTAIIP